MLGHDKLTPEGERFFKAMAVLQEYKVRIGFQAGAVDADSGADMADVAMWNEFGTETIPARPFMRDSVDAHIGEIANFMDTMLEKIIFDGMDAKEVLEQIGIFQKGLMQKELSRGNFKPNAPATIAKKGSAQPLIDTGRMRQSISYEIVGRDEEEEE